LRWDGKGRKEREKRKREGGKKEGGLSLEPFLSLVRSASCAKRCGREKKGRKREKKEKKGGTISKESEEGQLPLPRASLSTLIFLATTFDQVFNQKGKEGKEGRKGGGKR